MNKNNESGTALIAATILGLIFLGLMFWFSQWGWVRGEAQVHRLGGQKALQYADSGIQTAAQHLVSPEFNNTFLPYPSTASYQVPMDNGRGRVDVSMIRNNLTDQTLVDVYATGYYFLPKGTMMDPVTNQNAQMAAINAKYSAINGSQFLLAVSSGLLIDQGITAPAGIIYAQNVIFNPPGPITVGTVFYSGLVSPPNYLTFVTFSTSPSNAQHLQYPPRLAALGGAIVRQFYQSQLSALSGPADFSGHVNRPVGTEGFYVSGRVDIGLGGDFYPHGAYVIYATSDVYIHSNIVSETPSCNQAFDPANPPCTDSWVAVLSEGQIHIANGDNPPSAPNQLALTGNFVSNLEFIADTGGRGGGSRTTVYGGVVSLSNIQLSNEYSQRFYNYQFVQGTNLPLPNFVNQLQYQTLRGKYN